MSDVAPVHTFGSVECGQFNIRLSDYRLGLRQTWHSHQKPIITLLLTGCAREQVRGRDVVARPLNIGIKPAGIRHTDHFWPQGVRALRITLDTSLVSSMKELSITMDRWDWLTGSEAVRPLLRAAKLLQKRGRDGKEVEDSLYEALAALLPGKPTRKMADAPSWLREARDHLDYSYIRGVRLSYLARSVNVHPIYFARQFRRFFGCSVGSYVRKLQLRDSAHLLAARELSLSEVACQIGFSDQPHMTRIFSDQLGITPGQFRRLIK